MNVSVHNPFAGPIRAKVLGVKKGGHFTLVTVKTLKSAKGYPEGYVFDAPYYDVYLNHRFVKCQTEYFGKPSIEELTGGSQPS
jgi:hypothetical protein